MSETNQALFELARLVGAGIVGGLIASFATHRFTLSRERESRRRNRKRDFHSFVVQFRSEAADRYHPPHTFAAFYQNKVPNLRHAAATIADDFPRERRAEFDKLGYPLPPVLQEHKQTMARQGSSALLSHLMPYFALLTPNHHSMHVCEVRPRSDHRGLNLISDALPFGRL